MKFTYCGEFKGRTEWGEVGADDPKEAQLKLTAFGIENLQRLTASDGRDAPLILADEFLEALFGYKKNATSKESEQWSRRMCALAGR